jgi:hypothetical protein
MKFNIDIQRCLSTWILVGLMSIGPVASAANATAPLQEFTPDSFTQLIRSQEGQAFVLVVWSLDCEFCQASLTTLAHMRRRHPQLRIVTLATEQLADPKAARMIRLKLAKLGLTQQAWVFGSAPPEQLRYAIDPQWRGEMPRSYWFDGHGGVRPQSGVIVEAVVAQFLAQR